MSVLKQALADYLQLRQALGHELAEAGRLLPGLVAYLDARVLPTVTIEAALAWAQQATEVTGRPGGDHRITADDNCPRLRPLPVRDTRGLMESAHPVRQPSRQAGPHTEKSGQP